MIDLTKYEVILIGVSAGGLEVLSKLLSEILLDFPIPIIIVQHRSKEPKDLLEEILQSKCKIKIIQVFDKQKIEGQTVYIAPPDYHLLIEKNKTFSLSVDEPVNFSRPSIDVLFESAANVYSDKAIAILLTGSNSDGTLGMQKVRQKKGLTIAQDPGDAPYPIMPSYAIKSHAANYILSLNQIIELLTSNPIVKHEK